MTQIEDKSKCTEPDVVKKDPTKPDVKENEIANMAYVKPNTDAQNITPKSGEIDIDKTKSNIEKENKDKNIDQNCEDVKKTQKKMKKGDREIRLQMTHLKR